MFVANVQLTRISVTAILYSLYNLLVVNGDFIFQHNTKIYIVIVINHKCVTPEL